MKGVSEEAIADVLEIEPATVRRWLGRAAEQCDKINKNFMKNRIFVRLRWTNCGL